MSLNSSHSASSHSVSSHPASSHSASSLPAKLEPLEACESHEHLEPRAFGPTSTSTGRHCVVVRLSALGDVALVTGVLLHWQKTFGMSFTVITKEAFAPLFLNHPAVREVIALHNDDLHGSRQCAVFRQLAARFCGETLIDLHGTLRTRSLALLWKGPVHRYPKQAMARRLFLLSRGTLCKNALLRHNVTQRYSLALPQNVPASSEVPTPLALRPQFFLDEAEHQHAAVMLAPLVSRALAQSFATPFPLIALHPFATHASKTWPMTVWLQLAERLESQGIPYFWVGQGLSHGKLPGASFVNCTSLRELLGLLAQADMLVTGDSGPMHLAEGVGIPVVALFGPTCREWGFFPSGEHSLVLQSPMACRPCSLHGKTGKCELACMNELTPAKAESAILGILEKLRKSD